MSPERSINERPIAARTSFDFVRYANVWEDGDVLCAALEPVARGERLLSVASAGDNALGLLTLDPAEVVARDLSAAQLACVALRIAAFRRLERPALLAFLGVTPAADRLATFRGLAAELPPAARTFWEARPRAIAHGVIHAGKFERYFATFRRFVLPLVQSRGAVGALRNAASLEEQARIYDARWDHWRWRLLFRAFFSRTVMGLAAATRRFSITSRAGRRPDPRPHEARADRAADARQSWFVFIVTGSFAEHALPRYLRDEWFVPIRAPRSPAARGRPDRGGAGTVRRSEPVRRLRVHGPGGVRARVRRPAGADAPGGRMVYWNMMARRSRPEALAARARPLDELAAGLHARDRAWFYDGIHVDEVIA